MSIGLKRVNGLTCPVINCHVCLKQITDAKNGLVAYDSNRHKVGGMIFLHKGDCDSRKKYPHWVELSKFLIDLVENTGIKTGVENDSW